MIWLVMIASGLMTFASRFSMIGLIGNRPIPQRLRRLLTYTGPAVLAIMDNPRILAFIGAAVIAVWTRNVLATIATGMVLLWVLKGGVI